MPKLVDHDVRRRETAQVVQAAIAKRGIEGVIPRSVTAEAGVSAGRIQHYYASWEELVRGNCRELLKAVVQRFEAVDDDTTPVEKLRQLALGRVPTTPEFAIGASIWLAYEVKSIDGPMIAELVWRGHAGGVQEAAALLSECGVTDASAVILRLMATTGGLVTRALVGGLEPRGATELLENLIAEVLSGWINGPRVVGRCPRIVRIRDPRQSDEKSDGPGVWFDQGSEHGGNATVGISRRYVWCQRKRLMRTAVTLDDDLVVRIQELIGVKERFVLLCGDLETLIRVESARRLTALGGIEPEA